MACGHTFWVVGKTKRKFEMSKVLIFGGTPFSLVNFRGDLIKAIHKNGHQVFGLSGSDREFDLSKLEELNLEFHGIFLSRSSINIFREFYTVFLVFLKIKMLKPDLILSYSIKPVIYGALCSKIIGIKNYYSLISGVGYIFTNQEKRRNKLIFYLTKFLYKIALKNSRAVFFQNYDDIKLFRELGMIASSSKVIKLNGSGVNLEKFKFSVNERKQIKFLMVSRLLKDKGVYEYLDAAEKVKAKYPQVKFALIGDIDENPSSITRAEVEKISKKGVVEHLRQSESIYESICESTVCVLPSYREGTPRFLLEALSVGRPVITTNTAGCKDTVKDGWNGYLIEVGSSEALKRAFIHCIENSENLKCFGVNSRKWAEKHFDVDLVNQKILKELNL